MGVEWGWGKGSFESAVQEFAQGPTDAPCTFCERPATRGVYWVGHGNSRNSFAIWDMCDDPHFLLSDEASELFRIVDGRWVQQY